jgi:hypothetical protein
MHAASGLACPVAGTRLGGSSALAANPVPNCKQERLQSIANAALVCGWEPCSDALGSQLPNWMQVQLGIRHTISLLDHMKICSVRLSYNPYFSACFFSRNSVFLSQQISEQYFQL